MILAWLCRFKKYISFDACRQLETERSSHWQSWKAQTDCILGYLSKTNEYGLLFDVNMAATGCKLMIIFSVTVIIVSVTITNEEILCYCTRVLFIYKIWMFKNVMLFTHTLNYITLAAK